MASRLKQVSATGAAVSGSLHLKSLTLTGGSDAASVAIDDSTDGSGTDQLTLKAAAGATVQWRSADRRGAHFATAIHATLTGTGPLVTVEYE